MPGSILDKALAVVLGAGLAITLFAAGFGACCLRPTTQALSQLMSNFDASPYGRAQLTELAVATRDFTVDDYGRAALGEEGARAILASVIAQAARVSSAEGSPTADRWRDGARESRPADAYALNEDALGHLQDCNDLIRAASPALWIAAGVAAASLAALLLRRRRALAARALARAPLALIAAAAALAIWALIDFNGLFAAFHRLLFPQGNWTFSSESLLICMYPAAFWVGMGAVWLTTTVLLSILSIAIGIAMKKRA